MELIHDRYAARGDRACDLVTGEVISRADAATARDAVGEVSLEPLVELFEQGREASPRWVVADARQGSQLAALQRRAAAAARRRGFVALSIPRYRRLRALLEGDLRGRALLLLGGFGETLTSAREALVDAASRSPRPHLLLTFRAPDRAGLPTAVREARTAYAGQPLSRIGPRPEWPSDVQCQLQRAERAAHFFRSGRHAAAERLLRDVGGALARRRAYAPAARISLTLARLLLERGRLDAADDACCEALRLAESGGDEEMSRQARLGEAWIRMEQARLTEAEALLRALVVTTVPHGEPWPMAHALARCLHLQTRADEALGLVSGEVSNLAPLDASVASDTRVAILLAAGRVFDAGQQARGAVDMVARIDDPLAAAIAHTAHLRVLCASGDLALAETSFNAVQDLSRQAHAPFRAVWARLAWTEALMRAGRVADARSHMTRLRRIASLCPPLLKRAIQEVEKCSGRRVDGPRTVYAPSVAAVLVRIAHDEDDDEAAVRRVLERVASDLGTSRLELISTDAGPVTTTIRIGTGLPIAIGARVIESGIPIGFDGAGDGREAGTPVRLGSQLVGAIVGRWPLDRAMPVHAAEALDLAATIAAPRVEAMLVRARGAAQASMEVPALIGTSAGIEEVRRAIARAARAPFSVLIQGESGTGKELVARAIHQLGPRRERPFCDVNCAALPDDLLESELFGHVRGAFTGAVVDRPGLFEETNGGTLFMDEVAELSPRAQAKLLRVVQQQEVRRVGETFSRPVDVRLVAAANRDLTAEAEAGRFRHDLLYRFDVIRISIPPLRDRPGDAALLARHFWQVAAARVGTHATLGPAVVAELAGYSWPGNVRELQNVISALAVAAPARGKVSASLLPPAIGRASIVSSLRLDEARRQFDRRFIEAALAHAGGSRSRAARALGVSRQGLVKVMARLGIAQ